ncbi:FKBP-type peptidyl-prolyl cis-trans isomerase [Conyzicola nivalis]|uniref:peptidylprolyl isomerase n=1 Tax=Conyzicola nivalis TaxID=1477021 RepID=A0A916SEE7_9MICO|nr:FKBP-type peptidyl-prolyl cis-trans isomerase [Conyzicola nivalis]GGA92541.1 peptidylprolyl isomerase [Conyzicola nivalis]
MRTALSLVVVLGLVGSLAACSAATPEASADCTPAKSGKASESVDVSGKFGAAPTVKIDDPLTTKTTQRSVVIDGDGAVAEAGFDITAEFSVYNGTTGESIDATDYADAPVEWTLDESLIAGFTKTLQCSTAGSRVVGVIAPEDGIAAESLEGLGLKADDSLVVVADLLTAEKPAEVAPTLPKADGEDQPLPDGFPDIKVSIADDESGTPTLTLPGGDAPTELQLAVLKKGDGEEVGAGADVIVNYTGMNWATSEVFDSSWERGEPAPFNTAEVIPGFTQALEGQTVGSQILVVIPPALAYGTAAEGSTSELADQTLVFIIDIVGLG